MIIQRHQDDVNMAVIRLINHAHTDICFLKLHAHQRGKIKNPKLSSAIKTILYLPNNNHPVRDCPRTSRIRHNPKPLLQVKRIDEMKNESLIKDTTRGKDDKWIR